MYFGVVQLRTDNSTLLNQLHEAHGETLHARTELQNLNLKIESLQRASTEFQKMAETHIEERDNERSKRQKLEMEVKVDTRNASFLFCILFRLLKI